MNDIWLIPFTILNFISIISYMISVFTTGSFNPVDVIDDLTYDRGGATLLLIIVITVLFDLGLLLLGLGSLIDKIL